MEKRKKIIVLIVVALILAIVGISSYYWYENTYYVSTEDSKLSADIARVSPQVTGKLLELKAEEGQKVIEGQILGRQEMNTLPDTNMEMVLLRAPITGLIIKKTGTVGEIIAPGQPVLMLIDPNKIYVTANIEETKLGKILPGQYVEINVDTFDGTPFSGTIDSIGKASASTFALLPTSSGGNFTKVVQKVPVKIILQNPQNYPLLPGINVEVKIHVK
jgi:multidrug resistance efflux pump